MSRAKPSARHPITRGRPKAVSLTPKRLEAILEKVRNGVPPQTAAGTLGIPRGTWSRWLGQGRGDDAVEPYKSLADRLDAAVDEWHESRVRVIQNAGEKDARHAEWMLERRLRSEYGDPNRGGLNVQITVQTVVESPAFAEVMEVIWMALRAHPEAHADVEMAIDRTLSTAPEPLQLTAA